MSNAEFIKAALRTESPLDAETNTRLTTNARALHAVIGLCTETGELQDQFKRHIFYKKDFDPVNLKEEIGDIFWYLALLCDAAGFTFEECQEKVVAKLKTRYPDKYTNAAAAYRDLVKERSTLERVIPTETSLESVQHSILQLTKEDRLVLMDFINTNFCGSCMRNLENPQEKGCPECATPAELKAPPIARKPTALEVTTGVPNIQGRAA